MPHTIGHVSRDVQFDIARPDAHQLLAPRTWYETRSHLIAGEGALPRVHCAFTTGLVSLPSRTLKRVVTIVDQITRQFRLGVDQDWQREQLGIPKHVTVVAKA